jgi:hypothetical protein
MSPHHQDRNTQPTHLYGHGTDNGSVTSDISGISGYSQGRRRRHHPHQHQQQRQVQQPQFVYYDSQDFHAHDNSSVGGNSMSSGRGGGYHHYSRGSGRGQKWNNPRDNRIHDETTTFHSQGRGGRQHSTGARGGGTEKFHGGRHGSEYDDRNEARGGGRGYYSRGGGRGTGTGRGRSFTSHPTAPTIHEPDYSYEYGSEDNDAFSPYDNHEGPNKTYYPPRDNVTTGRGRATTTGRGGRNYSNMSGRKGRGRTNNPNYYYHHNHSNPRGEDEHYISSSQQYAFEDYSFHRGQQHSRNMTGGRMIPSSYEGRGAGRPSSSTNRMRFEIGAPPPTNPSLGM